MKKVTNILTNNKKLKSKYRKVQGIAFEIDTTNYEDKYPAKLDDNIDYKLRLKVVKDIIEKAYNSKAMDNNASTLKVFMLPEFFFRGKNGGYNLDTTSKIVEGLREIVKDPKYKDWLFVFGTMVGYAKKANTFETYNYSFIQKGNGEEKDSAIVMKEFKSTIDYITKESDVNNILTYSNTKHLPSQSMLLARSEEKKYNYDGNGILNIDGIRISLEICLDHIHGRINNSKNAKDLINIQLITSCGASIRRHNRYQDKNSFVFICDGDDIPNSRIETINRKRINTASKINVSFGRKNTKANNKDASILFKNDSGCISIYNTVNLQREMSLEM